MKKRLLALLNIVMLAVLTALVVPAAAVAGPQDRDRAEEPATEDVLYMHDGRALRGHIIEEKGDAIVFEVVDRDSQIRMKVTYLRSEIALIERGVAIEGGAVAEAPPVKETAATSQSEADTTTYGARRASADNENAPAFYFVPMKGQMGTDVHTDLYREMIDDIREAKPDVLVIEMECRDNEDVLYSLIGREERGLADFDEFRELINLFRDELSDIKQVLWIQDSVGVSSAIAMVWPDMYMTPDARLGGLISANEQTGFENWSDDDVRGKMTAAFMSWVKGFLEYGGYPLVLADAMVRPKFTLSGTWKGREVIWTLDTNGDYIVDSSDKRTANFRAKSAEDLCISDGTAETKDDLALLLGYREYRVVDGKAEGIFEDYRTNWRRTKDKCVEWMRDYDKFLGWANGQDARRYLGQAKGCLERVIAAMDRYGAVETRLGMEYGIRRFDLETNLEVLKERLRAMRGSGRGGRGGTGGGGLGGGG